MKAKLVKESLAHIPHFKTGWDIIEYFDSIPEFDPYRYRNEDSDYRDTYYYSIPANVFQKVLEWTPEDVESIKDNIELYEGNIWWETQQPDTRNKRGQVMTWKPLPLKDQHIIVTGGE